MTDPDWGDLLDAVTDIDPPTLSRDGRGATVREYVLVGIVVVLAAVGVYVFVW